MNTTGFGALLSFAKRHERVLSGLFFLGGLVSDVLTFGFLSLQTVIYIFAGYIVVASVVTIAAHAAVGKAGRLQESVTVLGPLIAHFALGSILSGFLILLTKSGSIAVSWPFIVLIGFVFIGNELFSTYKRHFIFQTILLFLAMYALTIIAVPFWLGTLGAHTFVISTIAALMLFFLYLGIISTIRWERLSGALWQIIGLVLGTTLLVFGAYGARLIPPIPLVLQEGGIYGLVERLGDTYTKSSGHSQPWWDVRTPVLVHAPGTPLYAYSAIFAPGAFSTSVMHVWQWYNPKTSTWNTQSTVTFMVQGGREGGYRGYTIKSNPQPGEWRILVQTAEGQTIGTIPFIVAQ